MSDNAMSGETWKHSRAISLIGLNWHVRSFKVQFDSKITKRLNKVWLVLKCRPEKDSSLYKEHVLPVISEQTTRFLGQCPLDRRDKSEDVCEQWTALWWAKAKYSISAESSHSNCLHGIGGCDDLGLFCNHKVWPPCNHWVNHELLSIQKYSRV